eukprot:6902853-Prymnesium_polylepis.1
MAARARGVSADPLHEDAGVTFTDGITVNSKRVQNCRALDCRVSVVLSKTKKTARHVSRHTHVAHTSVYGSPDSTSLPESWRELRPKVITVENVASL